MPRSTSQTQTTSVHLPAVLDMLAAAPLCEELRIKFQAGASLALDGSAVERVSTPCLQVLTAAALMAASRGLSFKLQTPSQTLVNALADLGLAQSLVS